MNLFLILIVSIAVVGAILVAFKRPFAGHLLWIISNLTLCVYNLTIEQYEQSTLFFIYLLLAIIGAYKWGRHYAGN